MRLPLRLQLKPSRIYFVFLASGHILAGVAVCLFPFPNIVRAAFVLVLGGLMVRLWHAESRRLPSLLLRRDGRIELMRPGVEPVVADVGPDTLVWPGLVVLHLTGGVSKPLVLFPDGLGEPDAHRQLRVWLRWRSESDTP
jgi:hypothetical protein